MRGRADIIILEVPGQTLRLAGWHVHVQERQKTIKMDPSLRLRMTRDWGLQASKSGVHGVPSGPRATCPNLFDFLF